MTADERPRSTDVWRELFRSDDHGIVQCLVTCLLAMEYDVCLRDDRGDITLDVWNDREARSSIVGAVSIDVRRRDHDDLHEVLDELIAEQRDFDACIDDQVQYEAMFVRTALAVVLLAGAGYCGYQIATGRLP